jgi:hypothetical protein
VLFIVFFAEVFLSWLAVALNWYLLFWEVLSAELLFAAALFFLLFYQLRLVADS